MDEYVAIARRDEIPEGRAKVVEIGGRAIAVFNLGGEYRAIAHACLHAGGPLGEGDVYGARVVCPLHGWEYDLTTGACVDDPAMKLACYRVKIEGDKVLIALAADGQGAG
jgi:nitrite reductase (NADH) small subunit